MSGLFTQLALSVWKCGAASGQSRESSIALSKLITQQARWIHQRYLSLLEPNLGEFIEGAPAEVFATLPRFMEKFEVNGETAQKDDFAAWSFTILEHQYLDLMRKQNRFYQHRGKLAVNVETDEDPAGGADSRVSLLDRIESLVEKLKNAPAIDGIIVGCELRLWDKLPAPLWNDWLDEANLTKPFPPAQYVHASKKQREILADLIGIKRNTLDQRISRFKRQYASLF